MPLLFLNLREFCFKTSGKPGKLKEFYFEFPVKTLLLSAYTCFSRVCVFVCMRVHKHVCVCVYFHPNIFQIACDKCDFHVPDLVKVLPLLSEYSHFFASVVEIISQTFFGCLRRECCEQHLPQEPTSPETALGCL